MAPLLPGGDGGLVLVTSRRRADRDRLRRRRCQAGRAAPRGPADRDRLLRNPLGQANAFTELGCVRREIGDGLGAARGLEQALAIYRNLDQPLGQANALGQLGTVRRETGDSQGAARVLEQALAIYRDLGNPHGQANAPPPTPL